MFRLVIHSSKHNTHPQLKVKRLHQQVTWSLRGQNEFKEVEVCLVHIANLYVFDAMAKPAAKPERAADVLNITLNLKNAEPQPVVKILLLFIKE